MCATKTYNSYLFSVIKKYKILQFLKKNVKKKVNYNLAVIYFVIFISWYDIIFI